MRRVGAVSVEIAIVLPVAFTFFFAAFEFARFSMLRPTVDSAVYDAARVAIVPGKSAADAAQTARKILATVGVKESSISIEPAVIGIDTPQVTVTINVPLDRNSWAPPKFLKGRQVRRTLTLQREGVAI